MTARELKELAPEQLQGRLQELQGELADVRTAVLAGSEKNHGRLRLLRRERARVLTVLRAALR